MPQLQTRAIDLQRKLSMEMMAAAADEGLSFDRYLEEQDPSAEYKDGLDAFERQLMLADIVDRDDLSRGIVADRFDVFLERGRDPECDLTPEGARALLITWMERTYRAASLASTEEKQRMERLVVGSDMSGLGTTMRPYVDAATVRYNQIQPAIPISELIAVTTGVDNDVYRSSYIQDAPAESRLVRVAQGAEIPAVKLSQSEKPVNLYKYGRRIDMTYEALRRLPLPVVAIFISRMAIFADVDKVSTIADVIINGDGNAGTAAPVDNLTALDSTAVTGKLTLLAWLNFKLKFKNPYALTTELVQAPVALQQLLLNVGTANVLVGSIPQNGFGGFVPINPELADNVRYGILDEAPALKVVGFDRRFCIERVYEIGADISESDQWIRNQTKSITFTETEGYAKLDNASARILDLNA